jgi:Domain of unknown function (DUF4234)
VAESLSVRGVNVKIRGPWISFLLAIVTLGIYYFVWYYKTNRELRDYGRAVGRDLGDSPFTSLLAITIGWLILVPPFVSMFATSAASQRQRRLRVSESSGRSSGSGSDSSSSRSTSSRSRFRMASRS